MVDRIVPAATPASLDHAAALLGLRDEAAVAAEGFCQWVIEDDFAAGRPAWEAAGAELVADVRPYQELKLRLVNGPHSAIAYLGALLGLPFVADVMADPALARFVERLTLEEIAPLTSPPPGFDVEGYAQAVLRRFANPWLRHRTLQIAMDGSQKIPVRWLPTLREAPAPRPALPAPRHGARRLAVVPPGPRRGRPRAAARRPDGGAPARGRRARRATTRGPRPGRRSGSRRCSAATCGRTPPS